MHFQMWGCLHSSGCLIDHMNGLYLHIKLDLRRYLKKQTLIRIKTEWQQKTTIQGTAGLCNYLCDICDPVFFSELFRTF